MHKKGQVHSYPDLHLYVSAKMILWRGVHLHTYSIHKKFVTDQSQVLIREGDLFQTFHVPLKHMKKHTFHNWTFEWGPSLIYFYSCHKVHIWIQLQLSNEHSYKGLSMMFNIFSLFIISLPFLNRVCISISCIDMTISYLLGSKYSTASNSTVFGSSRKPCYSKTRLIS